MKYEFKDLINIAKLFSGSGNIQLPESIQIDEIALYTFCCDTKSDTTILDEGNYSIDLLMAFLKQLADSDDFISFLNYYFSNFIDSHAVDLSSLGYNTFELKDKILNSLNALWSIKNEEFGIENNKITLIPVTYKEYDKMGVGGFCTVYQSQTENTKVYKVLNNIEKSDPGSVHRFKREFMIMSDQNESGYTLKVFDYDSKALVYSMEKADISLEDYVINNKLSDSEKDKIIIRCAECMKYLHNKGILHRDFHPGNILLNCTGQWMVTDFGLAKELSNKYSRQTTTTHAVGRAWFTDPIQLFALIDGSYQTDMYSLARTIDYIMNGNMSGMTNKYSSVIYKATAPDPDNRYTSIEEMFADLTRISERSVYKSPEEIIEKLVEKYHSEGKLDVVQIIGLLKEDTDGLLIWNIIRTLGKDMALPFISIIKISPETALHEIENVLDVMESSYKNWSDYDTVAYWAIEVINLRKSFNDEINITAAHIIEYVASIINRFDIMSQSNILRNDSSIDGHIRGQLTYHDGY